MTPVKNEVTDVPLTPITEGMISENVLTNYVAPKGSLSYSENMHNDALGYMTSRKPFVSRNTPGAAAQSMVLYQTLSSSQIVLWQESTTLKWANVTGSAITTYLTSSSANKNRYDICQGKVLITNDSVGQPKVFDGTGAPAALAGTFFPGATFNADLISAGFSQRVWVAGSNDVTNKLYYSDTIPAAGISSLTSQNPCLYLTINANDGDKITGFARTQNVLYVFTHNAIFRVYNTQSMDNTPLANVGAFCQESIVTATNGFYFYHPSGIYFIDQNGSPKKISEKIRDYINRVPSAYQSSVFGWSDDLHVYFCLGNKLQGMQPNKTYYAVYTIATQVWTIYSTINFLPTCASQAYFSTGVGITEDIYPTNYIIGQSTDSAGAVSGTFYGGTFGVYTPSTEQTGVSPDWGVNPIIVDIQTPWINFGIETRYKRVNGISIPAENGAGLKFAYQVDKDKPNEWRTIGILSEDFITLFKDFQSKVFNRIKFRVYGDSKGAEIKVGAPTILQVDDQGYKHN